MTGLDRAYEINKAGLHIIEETDAAYCLANYDRSLFVWLNKEPENEFVFRLLQLKESWYMKPRLEPFIEKIIAKEIMFVENIKNIDMGSM